jgi:hypothetical protein
MNSPSLPAEFNSEADIAGRVPVLVKGAEADQIRAVPLQRHSPRHRQPLDGDLLLQSLELKLGDSGHGAPPFKTLSSRRY